MYQEAQASAEFLKRDAMVSSFDQIHSQFLTVSLSHSQ